MLFHFILALLSADGGERHRRVQPQCPPILAGWLSPADGLPEHRIILAVRVRGNQILWADRPVSRRTLRTYLSRSRAMEPAPFITFDPAGAADCATATAIRDLIDESARCGEELFCGQGSRREWNGLSG